MQDMGEARVAPGEDNKDKVPVRPEAASPILHRECSLAGPDPSSCAMDHPEHVQAGSKLQQASRNISLRRETECFGVGESHLSVGAT